MEQSEIISIMAANEDLVKNLQRIKTGDRIRVIKHETSQTLEASTEFSVMEKLSEKELQEGAFSEFRFKVFEAGDGHGDGFTFNISSNRVRMFKWAHQSYSFHPAV